MIIRDICEIVEASVVCGDDTKPCEGVYAGDFLSRAMSRVQSDNLWITIMSNVNVIAVATLTEPAAILLAEGVTLQADALASAEENGITVLSSPLSAYELCARIHQAFSEKKA